MTEREAEILDRLVKLATDDAEAFNPLSAVGGATGTHHTMTISRMVAKGWVERRRRFENRPRAGWGYRLTPKGLQALHNHRILKVRR